MIVELSLSTILSFLLLPLLIVIIPADAKCDVPVMPDANSYNIRLYELADCQGLVYPTGGSLPGLITEPLDFFNFNGNEHGCVDVPPWMQSVQSMTFSANVEFLPDTSAKAIFYSLPGCKGDIINCELVLVK